MLAEQSLARMSIKLHGITPDKLPPDLRAALMTWLTGTDARLLQGFIRPGCVHLSLDCMLPQAAAGKLAATPSSMSAVAGVCSFLNLESITADGWMSS
jgi:hypothetical protein